MYTTGKINTIQSIENFQKQLNVLKQTPRNLCQQLIKAAKYYGYLLLLKRTVALPLHKDYWLKIKLGNGSGIIGCNSETIYVIIACYL